VGFWSILVLAVGLAMDATAVAASRGLAAPAVRVRDVAAVALLFGGFQALMPLAGWLIGSRIGPFIERWDHWLVFAVLGSIGVKMLVDAWRGDGAPPADFRLTVLLVLAVATSIDAFAVGITLPLLGAPAVLTMVTIGITTAILSGVGVLAGRRFGALLGRRLDAVGGVVLILMGIKILLEHLSQ
jgi:manganese efflux pump family protein